MSNSLFTTEEVREHIKAEQEKAASELARENWEDTAEKEVLHLQKSSNQCHWGHYEEDRPYVAEILRQTESPWSYLGTRYKRERFVMSSLANLLSKLSRMNVSESVRLVSVRRASKAETQAFNALDSARTDRLVSAALVDPA
ncbi:MAG: hypothetical protein HN341_00880 [Verrucomicrobia bacterium]|jgi:hypothetical protein|nr:hypothetical protein [Verrucomicrobiota bacterium]